MSKDKDEEVENPIQEVVKKRYVGTLKYEEAKNKYIQNIKKLSKKMSRKNVSNDI
jgi:ribosomal protein S8